jgi:acetyltransferase-like isoleucine patch superfamily enzyme
MYLLINKIKRKLRKLYRKHIWGEASPNEMQKKKQSEDYEYLKKCGVETELGYVTLYGKPIIHKEPGSIIRMGKDVVLTSDSEVNTAGINHPVIIATHSKDAEIILENNVGMSGVSINCVSRCVFKEGVMLGANVNVWDTDFHPIDPQRRIHQTSIMDAKSSPIILEKNVWVGANTTILKGITIGENTVVGAMSLVNKNLPSNSVCAGNPAKKIKDL